ncbi:hypothetical protein IV102_02350 [bacterium]|nr:hypothetical protein [bacterium]
MNQLKTKAAAGILFLAAALNAFAQPTYPQAPKPKPKPSASATASPSASPSASASPDASPSPKLPTGPLKMITTDSVNPNKKSPIKFTEINFYDSGYGSKYNAEMRLSGAVLNSSKTDTLKKVTVKYQVVDTAGQVVQEWKESAGDLKPGSTYRINPGVARNTLGTMLKGKMVVDHEEVPPKDGAPKDGAK